MQKLYETTVKNDKMVFKITDGPFKDVEYVYESLDLNGDLKYKIRTKKNLITPQNTFLFENTIRKIIRDKLSKL